VRAGAGQPRAVGAEADAADEAGVALQGADLLAALGVPDLHRSIHAGRGEELAVGAEAHAEDTTVVALEGEKFLACFRVPELHLPGNVLPLRIPQVAGGGEALAVRTEADAENIAGVALEGEDFLPGPGVPDPQRLVRAGGGEARAVGAEAH